MSSFFAGVLAFLLAIFPGCQYLQIQHQAATYDRLALRDSIIAAVKERDIFALEAMMCQEIKTNTKDLPEKIGVLIDAIDGEIVECEWSPNGGSSTVELGKRVSREGWSYEITTSTGSHYMINISWVIIDTKSPETMGLFEILLRDADLLTDFVSGKIDDPELCVLARISAGAH